MATVTWGGKTGTQYWNTSTNWKNDSSKLSVLPGTAANVAIGSDSTDKYRIIINSTATPITINSLALAGTGSSFVNLTDEQTGFFDVANSTTLQQAGLDVAAGATAWLDGNVSLDASSSIQDEGVTRILAGLSNDGTVRVSTGILDIHGSVTGSGSIVLSNGGFAELAGATANAIQFGDDNGNVLQLDNPGSTFTSAITGFGGTDSIDITTLAYSDQLTYTYHQTSGSLVIQDGAETVFTFSQISTDSDTQAFALSDDGQGGTLISDPTTCYVAGTRILTARGEVAVEDLRAGDGVAVRSGDGTEIRPIRWIGQRRINLAAHPKPATVLPVRIRKDAFATGVPHRDLLLSPDHAVFVDGVLLAVRQLINGTTIRQETGWPSVRYFHIELDTHAILLAEGLPAESYLDTGNRGFFANADAPLVLHPDLTADGALRAAGTCAPFAVDAATVQPIWRRLADRAAALGRTAQTAETTSKADLRVQVNGRTVKPIYAEDGLSIFPLPASASLVRLVSRTAAPADSVPWLDDRRALGVSVGRMVLRSAGETLEIALDAPALADGWWAVERDGQAMHRWTNGNALLRLPESHGAAMLEVVTTGNLRYPLTVETTPMRKVA